MGEYGDRLKAFYSHLGCAKKMVLATCENDRVTARTMSVVLLDGNFYFQTDQTSMKYEQISANPLVALCVDNIQIEGVAGILGHPLMAENRAFAIAFEQSYPGSFNAYSHLKREVVIQVQPKTITVWDYENGKPFRVFFDVSNQTYAKEFYMGE